MAVVAQKITDQFAAYQGDCCEVIPDLPDESVGLSIFSPPFSDLYCYSDSPKDMGNSRSYSQFFEHFTFLATELHRVTMPGRIVAVHCMDLPIHKRDGGDIAMRDFPGDLIQAFQDAGFLYHCRICIWKDPLLAAVRTKAIGLAHKQIVKDSSVCRVGIADSLLVFRKKGENPKPIKHPSGLKTYYGATSMPKELDRFDGWEEPKTNKRSHWIWQQYASPVWTDIRQTRVLPYRDGREDDDMKHICPLQRDVVSRCLVLWSAKGDNVLSPFMGIGT